MSLRSACRVQRILTIQTSVEAVTRVFKKFSSVIPKISCSVCEMQENRFFENKSLFLKETHMFLCSPCRVQRILSIQTSFERITRVFKELLSIITELSCSVGEMQENRRLSLINHYFSKKHTCSCVLLLEGHVRESHPPC